MSDGDDLIAGVVERLSRGKPVRVALPGKGRVHIDRTLPFLVLHVAEPGRPAPLAREVASSNASYALVSGAPEHAGFHRSLIEAIRGVACDRCGGFVTAEILESDPDPDVGEDAPILPDYDIGLCAGGGPYLDRMAARMKDAFEAEEIFYRRPAVDLSPDRERPSPALRLGIVEPRDWLALALPPVYRQPGGDAVYPELFEALVATALDALLQGLADYCRAATPVAPAHHRALGRRVLIKAIRTVDRKLDAITRSFDFLLSITPINSRAAWEEFRGDGMEREPPFQYRPLAVSTDEAKRALHSLPLDHLEDPVLARLFREKQHETDHQLTMLQCRGTTRFRDASRLLYGNVDPALDRAARGFLAQTTEARCPLAGGESVGCVEIRMEAEAALAAYRQRHPGFDATVAIRDDIPAGLMVTGPCLLISSQTAMARARLDALLQHEIGVHLVTYYAGRAQELAIFRSGLAGYEGIQEGLGVFAEYAVGGLGLARLRLLCGRVVACAAMLDGASFLDTFRVLTREFGFGERTAFTMSLRVHRSGGLSKDAIYLRGLMDVLALLEMGGSLEPFWFGKVARSHLPVMAELDARGMLRPPPVKPEFLDRPDALARIERARQGLSLDQLIAA